MSLDVKPFVCVYVVMFLHVYTFSYNICLRIHLYIDILARIKRPFVLDNYYKNSSKPLHPLSFSVKFKVKRFIVMFIHDILPNDNITIMITDILS